MRRRIIRLLQDVYDWPYAMLLEICIGLVWIQIRLIRLACRFLDWFHGE